MQANYAAQSMEIIADNSTASPAPQRQYNIDREELLRLREDKLIQDKTFVYIAIKLSYDCSDPSIDISWFCEQWGLKEVEFAAAITQLQKRGALQPVARQLTLQLF